MSPGALRDGKRALQETIGEFVSQGFVIDAQTDTTAQMVKPKKFAFVPALLWFLLFGVGVLV